MLENRAQRRALTLMSHADDAPTPPPDEFTGDTGSLTVWTGQFEGLEILVAVKNHDGERWERSEVQLQGVGGGQDELVEAAHPCGGITVVELRQNAVVGRDGHAPGVVA